MPAAMGGYTFAIGRVDQPVSELLASPAVQRMLNVGIDNLYAGHSSHSSHSSHHSSSGGGDRTTAPSTHVPTPPPPPAIFARPRPQKTTPRS